MNDHDAWVVVAIALLVPLYLYAAFVFNRWLDKRWDDRYPKRRR